ncbi:MULTISPECIES: hypothetical protein [Luteimonas]|uniref:hypothetical protein n=1 Tax=Luteimonas TaxID=83614 RepID=UPI000C7D215C|nr:MULTISPECIES: hypothetical protein [Luteimonas]
MANPWDNDPIVSAAGTAPDQAALQSFSGRSATPWEDDPLEIDIEGGTRESAFDQLIDPLREGGAERRGYGLGARSVVQGAGSLLGALGGDAFNAYIATPIERAITGRDVQPQSYRDAGARVADQIGLPTPQNARERVLGDVGEALTGTGLSLGVGGGLNALVGMGRSASATATTNQLARLAETPKAPVNRLAELLSAQPGLQVAGTATGSAASSITREQGGTQGQQLAAGLAGALGPSMVRVGAPAAASGALSGSVPAQRKELARQASDMGINLTPAQLSDSRFLKWTQSMLRSVPFTGAQGRYEGQVRQFNRQLAREIGEDADNIGPDVYAQARDRQSALFDALTERNAMKVDDQLVRSLGNIGTNSKMAGAQIQSEVDAAIDALYSQATTGPNGVVVPGRAYQAFDAQLNNIIKNGGTSAHFLGNVQSAVRKAMDQSISPEDALLWRELRREYGSRKSLTPLVAKASEGQIPPAQVLGAVSSTRAGKEAMASGRRGNIGDLARIGQLMKEPPTSGSAERGLVGTMMGAGAYIDPVTGTLTAGALNLLSRGVDSQSLGRLMIQENPGLTPGVVEQIIARSIVPAAVSVQGR